MSWRGSGSFRSSRPSSARGNGPQTIWEGGSAGGPPLLPLIIATVALGVALLIAAIAFGAVRPQTAAPAAQPTAAPAAQPTAAPAAQPTAAPAAGAAAIPTEPQGPALATGSGEAASLGSDGDLLAFDQASLTVPEGLVSLTFVNNASAVQHNWVLVDGGEAEASEVNNAAAAQVATARNALAAVPPADTPNLLVATQMLNPGEEATVTFETPGPGTYTFLCTFPGHYAAGMQGELVVE